MILGCLFVRAFNAGIGFPVSGSGIVYCCEENTTVAEIGQEAPSPDINDPGSARCMDEVDFCEKGHHKGLVSSANTNVGKEEVREVDVISYYMSTSLGKAAVDDIIPQILFKEMVTALFTWKYFSLYLRQFHSTKMVMNYKGLILLEKIPEGLK